MVKLLRSKNKGAELDWRRVQVLELTSLRVIVKREIAAKLQLDAGAVNRDIQFLKLASTRQSAEAYP